MSDLLIMLEDENHRIEHSVELDKKQGASSRLEIGRMKYYKILLCFLSVFYFLVFVSSILLIGILEIRQSNMVQYNGFIAALTMKDEAERRDVGPKNAEYLLSKLDTALETYYGMRVSLSSPDACNDNHDLTDIAPPESTRKLTDGCGKLKQAVDDNIRELLKTKIDLINQNANRDEYYYKYIDGQITKTPQMAPILPYLTSTRSWGSRVLRMPIEWLEMVLLILMGVLGGLIGVTKSLVDQAHFRQPRMSDLFYRPAVGAVVALAAFVLFRAGQMLLGNENPGGTVTGATGLFLLAFLGLVSGLRAKEVVDQLEASFSRVFQRGSNAEPTTAVSSKPDVLKPNQGA